MYERYGLVLAVNHACNLRCTYCYTGDKFNRVMPLHIGERAIDRAINSINIHGTLELGFFGGEPLIESHLIATLIHYARRCADPSDLDVQITITTNGTITDPVAWSVMMDDDVELTISFDGLPSVHDRHRLTIAGQPTSRDVIDTMTMLMDAGKRFNASMVVRPDTVEHLSDGIRFLRSIGLTHVTPTLDLWTRWNNDDGRRLLDAVSDCAELWREGLPECGISWFDQKAYELARRAGGEFADSARCGFGTGEIAVAPSGRMYPCERVTGEDRDDNPMRLRGDVMDGQDFLSIASQQKRCDDACGVCPIQSLCNTTCRCSNFIRTGNPSRPDRLLCMWNEACLREAIRVGVPAEAGSSAVPSSGAIKIEIPA